ncbi:MAG: aminotransferase class I/II-fold pyridoxal phosphate-dependent enzyme, partial [Bacteroidetes bacterium]|nr:aminotransferase class I/II-fold pyridoxal phosphate-dependent enzyme [Candidatus Cryptobacteroides merdavium]
MELSKRMDGIGYSPIRKLSPLADSAKSKGLKVYHLNIGQPDIQTPKCGLDALKDIGRTVLEYSPSEGLLSLRRKLSEYYAVYGMDYSPGEIIVTTGASEALLFLFLTCLDPGDEIITVEPTYANYLSFAAAAGVKVVPVAT